MRGLVTGLALAVVAAIVVVIHPAPAHADYRWQPTATNIGVYVYPSAAGRGYRITRAIREWREGLPASVTLRAVSAPCVGCITVAEVPGKIEGYPTYSGMALWQFVSEWGPDGVTPVLLLSHCDIVLSSPMSFPQYRPSIMAHELGHCLGLEHVAPESHSVMTPGISPDGIDAPTAEDIARLRLAYGVATQPRKGGAHGTSLRMVP